MELENMKTVNVPGKADWCIYYDTKGDRTGFVGHRCKGFKTSFKTMDMYYVTPNGKTRFNFRSCVDCREEIPSELETLLKITSM